MDKILDDIYMKEKRSFYEQYENIILPKISFEKNHAEKILKQIDNILYIMKKSESFIFNERFVYYKVFKGRTDLLNEINFVLESQRMKPISSLIILSPDLGEEAINFCFDNFLDQNKIKSHNISNLLRIIEENKNEEEIKIKQYDNLKKEFKEISSKYEKLVKEFEEYEEEYYKDKENLKTKIIKLKNENVQIKTEKNELSNN